MMYQEWDSVDLLTHGGMSVSSELVPEPNGGDRYVSSLVAPVGKLSCCGVKI
jgi:hypothetical protein